MDGHVFLWTWDMTLDFGLHGAGGELQDCMASDWLLWDKSIDMGYGSPFPGYDMEHSLEDADAYGQAGLYDIGHSSKTICSYE